MNKYLQNKMVSLEYFMKHLEYTILILCKLFQKIKGRKFPNSFYEANKNLIPKPNKNIMRK